MKFASSYKNVVILTVNDSQIVFPIPSRTSTVSVSVKVVSKMKLRRQMTSFSNKLNVTVSSVPDVTRFARNSLEVIGPENNSSSDAAAAVNTKINKALTRKNFFVVSLKDVSTSVTKIGSKLKS